MESQHGSSSGAEIHELDEVRSQYQDDPLPATGTNGQVNSHSTTQQHRLMSNLDPERDCAARYPVPEELFAVCSRRPDEDHEYLRLDNPFYNWLPDDVVQVAKRIACEYELNDLQDLFIKAAKVVSDPRAWRTVDGITDEETSYLESERQSSFWDQPWPLQITFLLLFTAAIVQGWNQTATNGANLSWWKELRPEDFVTSSTNTTPRQVPAVPSESGATLSCGPNVNSIWAFATVNAAPYLAASVGCWISDPLINELLFGRLGAIRLSALLVLGSAIGGSLSTTWQGFLISRVFLGVGMGCKAAVVPVFAAEIAPAHLRGPLVMNWQVFDALGIFLGFSANLIASITGSVAWRWQIASSAIPAFALICGSLFIRWDSPRFLMKQESRFRRHHQQRETEREYWTSRTSHSDDEESMDYSHPDDPEQLQPAYWKRLRHWLGGESGFTRLYPKLPYRSEAYKTLVLLRGQSLLAAKELIYAHCQLLVEMNISNPPSGEPMDFDLSSKSSWLGRSLELFTIPHIRREVYAAAVVMISQQLCGVNILIFFSSTVFCDTGAKQADSTSVVPLLLSWAVGLINVVGALPAYRLIETRGRRWLLLNTLPYLALSMAGAAASFSIPNEDTQRGIVAMFMFIFMIFYSPGLGPVPFTLSAEMFPLEHRMVGMSLAVSLNFLSAGLLTLFVPLATNKAWLLGVFACLNVVAYVLVWIFVREVASEPSESLQLRHRRARARRDRRGPPRNQEGSKRLRTLEELFYIFRWPTSKHLKFQMHVTLPYDWKKLMCKLRLCFGSATLPTKPDDYHNFDLWAQKTSEATSSDEGM